LVVDPLVIFSDFSPAELPQAVLNAESVSLVCTLTLAVPALFGYDPVAVPPLTVKPRCGDV